MSGWELVVSFVAGLIVNEMTDISPWAARKLVRWAAYRWTTDPEIAAGYAEEWAAIIDERPGKLFKLITAVQFLLGAAGRSATTMFARFREASDQYLQAAGIPRGSVLRWFYYTALTAMGGALIPMIIDLIGGGTSRTELLLPVAGMLYFLAEVLWRLGHGQSIRVRKRPDKPSASE